MVILMVTLGSSREALVRANCGNANGYANDSNANGGNANGVR